MLDIYIDFETEEVIKDEDGDLPAEGGILRLYPDTKLVDWHRYTVNSIGGIEDDAINEENWPSIEEVIKNLESGYYKIVAVILWPDNDESIHLPVKPR